MAEWNKERAAQLLQAGMMGKDVAAEVGTSPSVISKWRDYLMGMKVPPLEEVAVDSSEIEPAPMPPQPIEETQTAPVKNIPQSADEVEKRYVELKPSRGGEKLAEKKPDIQVTIDIGKGRVQLEAENAKVLETLINMMVAMGGRE